VKVGLPDVTRHAAQLPEALWRTAELFGELLKRPTFGLEVIPPARGEQRSQGFFTQDKRHREMNHPEAVPHDHSPTSGQSVVHAGAGIEQRRREWTSGSRRRVLRVKSAPGRPTVDVFPEQPSLVIGERDRKVGGVCKIL